MLDDAIGGVMTTPNSLDVGRLSIAKCSVDSKQACGTPRTDCHQPPRSIHGANDHHAAAQPASPPAAPPTPTPPEPSPASAPPALSRSLFTAAPRAQQGCRLITLHRTARVTPNGTILHCSVSQDGRTRDPCDDEDMRALAQGAHGAIREEHSLMTAVVADPVILPEQEAEEPLLRDGDERFCLYPIRFPELFEFYKKSVASFWPVEEVDLGTDVRDWLLLSDDERHFLKYVLAFFASSDGIVMENLAVRFMADVTAPEARAFYGFQIAMENVHSEMYSLLLDTYIRDKDEKHTLFRAVESVPCIARKAAWAKRWITDPTRCFAERLVAFACVEGIHFSGSFCAIYWIKQRGPIMPGLTFSNELISRDEGLHTDFACALYGHLRHKLPAMVVYEIVSEAVALEEEFCTQALSVRLIGMSASGMTQYIQFVADRLLVALGYERLYHVANPFPWMDMISLQGKSNFFERRVGEYQRANVMQSREEGGRPYGEHVFTLDADF